MTNAAALALMAGLALASAGLARGPASPAWERAGLRAASEWQDYVVVFKRRGPKFATEKTPPSHWEYLKQIAEGGKIAAVGPLTDDGEIRGVSIFFTSSIEEARRTAESDPAVKIGRFSVEAQAWRGPAGIGARFAEQAKNTSDLTALPMTTYYLGLLRGAPEQTARTRRTAAGWEAAHWRYIQQISRAGKVSAAGLFAGEGRWLSMVVFQVKSKEEAEQLAAADPAARAGMTMDLHPWMVATGTLPQAWVAPALGASAPK